MVQTADNNRVLILDATMLPACTVGGNSRTTPLPFIAICSFFRSHWNQISREERDSIQSS